MGFADMVAFHFFLIHVFLTADAIVAFIGVLVDVPFVLDPLKEVAH